MAQCINPQPTSSSVGSDWGSRADATNDYPKQFENFSNNLTVDGTLDLGLQVAVIEKFMLYELDWWGYTKKK